MLVRKRAFVSPAKEGAAHESSDAVATRPAEGIEADEARELPGKWPPEQGARIPATLF